MTFNCIYRYKPPWYLRISSQLQYVQTARRFLNKWLRLFIFPSKWGKNLLGILFTCVFMMMLSASIQFFLTWQTLIISFSKLMHLDLHAKSKPNKSVQRRLQEATSTGYGSDMAWSQIGGCMLIYLTQRSYSRLYIFANHTSFSP